MSIITNGLLNASISWNIQTYSQPSLGSTVEQIDRGTVNASFRFSSGTGNGQINQIYHTTGSIPYNGGSTDINLESFTFTILGLTGYKCFDAIKGLYISNTNSASGGFLRVDTRSKSGFDSLFGGAGTLELPPSSTFVACYPTTGIHINSGTGFINLSNIHSTGQAISYELGFMGTKCTGIQSIGFM